MRPQNCWEYVRCGREPGGSCVDRLGVCPAAVARSVDGVNGGQNGGRVCWFLAGTYCEGRIQGVLAKQRSTCRLCGFMSQVEREQHPDGFVLVPAPATAPACAEDALCTAC